MTVHRARALAAVAAMLTIVLLGAAHDTPRECLTYGPDQTSANVLPAALGDPVTCTNR